MDRVTRKSYVEEAGRHVKRALIGRRRIQLMGRSYIVAFEARHYGGNDTRDLDVISKCAVGRRCILDVGANMGITVLMMSAAAPDAAIHAFEASEATSLIIRENVALNHVPNVTIVNALIGAVSGLVSGFHWDFASGAASAVHAPPSGSSLVVRKSSLALDDYVTQHGLEPDFVKIDIEGAEAVALRGLRGSLDRFRPDVFVEVHAWPGMSLRRNMEQLLDIAGPANYRIVLLRSKEAIEGLEGFTTSDPSSISSPERVLFVPKERAVPSWLATYDTSGL